MKFNVNFSQKRNEQNIIHNLARTFFSQINLLPAFPKQTTEKTNKNDYLSMHVFIYPLISLL